MAKFPTMPLRTDALIADTSHLSPTEFGAYVRLIVAMWRNGGWLPSDEKRLARYATLSAGQWARSRDVIMELFTPADEGRITQGRLTREWAAAEQRSHAAKDSADARWRKTKENGDAYASEPDMLADAIQYPVSKDIGGGGVARTGDAAHDAILVAAGIDPSKDVTGKWLGLSAQHEVASWRNLGLSQAEIIAVIRETLSPGRSPPGALSYFRQPMQRAAGRKTAAPLDPIPPEPQRGPNGRRVEPPSRAAEIADAAAERFIARRREMAERTDQGAVAPLLLPGGHLA